MSRFLRLALALMVAAASSACAAAQTAPANAPPVPVSESPESLRIACYNTWLLPFFSEDLPNRRARLPDALVEQDADVVCLQEVWSPEDRHTLAEALKADYPHSATGVGGLQTLSRHPIVSHEFVRFPPDGRLGPAESLARKGLLDVVIRTERGDLRIVNSHLASPRNPGPEAARKRQLEVLLEHVHARAGLPLIVAADLNIRSVDRDGPTDEYRLITGKYGLRYADPPRQEADGRWVASPDTRVGWPRHTERMYGWTPDVILLRDVPDARLLVTSTTMTLDTPDTALSDHNLLIADLQIVRDVRAR